jgi:NOL1/NOP2/sun family putative RNA methylase
MEEKAFRDWLSTYTDADRCIAAFHSQKRFFRVNTIKISPEKFAVKTNLKCTCSPYYDCAFELQEKESFQIGRTWEYFLCLIYPQSLPSILDSLALAPTGKDIVLDVAASPGSKFSHMAMLMKNKGVLVANDRGEDKISALYATINRMNILNCIVTDMDGAKLPWNAKFSKILVDAPCSALGSGMAAAARWEPANSMKISNLQKRMLFSAFDALQPGGELVYSTCTYAKEENEEVVANLLQNVKGAKLVDIGLDIPHDPGLGEYGEDFKRCYRVYPHHLQSEGFFMAKIRKG